MDESKGQAGGVLTPVAQMVALDDGLGTVILNFLGPRPPAGTFLFTRPTPAAAAGVPTDVEDVQRVLGYLRADEAEIRGKTVPIVWADTMARASDLIRNLAASPVAPAGAPALTDEQVFDLARRHFGGKGHALIWEDDPMYAASCDMPKDARWIAGNVMPHETLAFARALLSAGSQGEQHDSSHEAARCTAVRCTCKPSQMLTCERMVDSSHEAARQSSVASPAPRSSLPETDDSALPREQR